MHVPSRGSVPDRAEVDLTRLVWMECIHEESRRRGHLAGLHRTGLCVPLLRGERPGLLASLDPGGGWFLRSAPQCNSRPFLACAPGSPRCIGNVDRFTDRQPPRVALSAFHRASARIAPVTVFNFGKFDAERRATAIAFQGWLFPENKFSRMAGRRAYARRGVAVADR